jgi:DNA-directed RNA polymerase
MMQALGELTADQAETYIPVNPDWQHGDEPQSHPMWEAELALEEGMLKAGADKLRDAVIIAQQKQQFSRVKPVANLMQRSLVPVADQIMQWRKAWAGKRGVKPMHLDTMKEIDPYVAAVVGVRSILDRIGHNAQTVTNIAMEIGRTLEHELKIRAWEKGSKQDQQLYRDHLKHQARNKATSAHLALANINRFNHHLKEGNFENVTWSSWSTEMTFRVGWEVMDAVVMATGWFEVIEDPNHRARPGVVKSAQLVLSIKEKLSGWVKEALDYEELNCPDFLPTVMPPKPWTNTSDGGYWTPYVKTPRLIRFKASHADQREGAAQEYDALDFPEVYSALNVLQDTAYRINAKVLEVFSKCWTELRWDDEAIRPKNSCLPALGERERPARTARMHEHYEANKGRRGKERSAPDEQTLKDIIEWKRRATAVHAFNARRGGRTKSTSAILQIATKYAQYDAIHFPHMLDFRGRMYPIPAYLQPQGNDLARGLLTYATEAPITEDNEGVQWLAVCLCSNWGNDKWDFEDRIKWTKDNETMLRRIAADPYENKEWFHCDKPWQFLACCFEWVAYLDAAARGETYYCSLPGMMDGTCNGIQHLAAMTRDEVAGQYVNLTPSDKPQDIYKFIAQKLQVTVEEKAQGDGLEAQQATWWLERCQWDLPRGLTKRPVMVVPYGGTKDSFFTYTREWLDAEHPLPEDATDEDRKERTGLIIFLASLMWETVKDNIKGPVKVMEWLKLVAKIACEADQPVFWMVPSGFVVRHFYGVLGTKAIRVRLDGEKHDIQIGERSNKLSVKEQLQGVSPNFVHSLDASALTTCINMCKADGITEFSSVHDAYGTHMANMAQLARRCREAFVWTHEHDNLGAFRSACLDVAEPAYVYEKGMDPVEAREKLEALLPPDLPMGSLNLESVLESPYFFH